jgi:heptosyltransferase-2
MESTKEPDRELDVLIVKIAAIGDVIMALPMIEAVRSIDREARITWLCGEGVAPLIEAVGGVDELIAVSERKLLAGTRLQKLSALTGVCRRLAGRRFDLVVTGHRDKRYRLLSSTVRGAVQRSFGCDGGRLCPVPGRHHSDEYVRLVSGADSEAGRAVLPTLSLPLSQDLAQQLGAGLPTVAIAPGGAKNVLADDALRRWPIENYAALARSLAARGFGVVVTGGPGDEWVRDAFAGLPVIDLVGKTSLLDTVALFGGCSAVVTHDSGPLHLAGLAGTPVVALFGPTNPYEKVPRVAGSKIIWGGEVLACRPCYDGRTYVACNDPVCMRSIAVDDVCEAVAGIVGS